MEKFQYCQGKTPHTKHLFLCWFLRYWEHGTNTIWCRYSL